MNWIIVWLLNSVVIFASGHIFRGIYIRGILAALLAGFLFQVLNSIIGSIVLFLTLPITVLMLGFFVLVIDARMILLVSKLMTGFRIEGFWKALLLAFVLALMHIVFL